MARHDASLQRAIDLFSDWRWRLNNLYWITDKEGAVVPFKMNWAQDSLFSGMHYLNVVLKARQLGFSTFIAMFMLDSCVFNSNTSAGIIDVTLDDAKKKLAKIKFAYDRLPDGIKQAVPIKAANAFTIEFANGSSIAVGTSHRGGTLQYLHISEFGKICAKHPEKAREIVTGALNTIQAGQVAWIESTAEGQEGRFFEICDEAQSSQRLGTKLTPLDFKFFFFAWWQAPEYRLPADGVTIPEQFARYFDDLERDGIKIDAEQKAWYVKKAALQIGDMKREFPSTPREAFEASIEGAIYGGAMEAAELERRIGSFPAVAGVPVHTFWDIGRRDYTSIWFAQILWEKDGPQVRLVSFYQNKMTGMPHYAQVCKDLFARHGWTRGQDYFPHDARVVEWGSDRSRLEQLAAAGFDARIATELSLHDGINAGRATLPVCVFDKSGCAEGVDMLKRYRWEWDDKRGAWKTGTPWHGDESHGADAFRTLATGWREVVPSLPPADRLVELHKRLTKPKTVNDVIEEFEAENG